MKVLVTGASGFVGTPLVDRIVRDSRLDVRVLVRSDSRGLPAAIDRVIGDLGGAVDWGTALAGIDVVVHLAARAHVMRDMAADPLEEFRRINVRGTLALARHAAAANVGRVVYLSSVKVNGECGRFSEGDVPAPTDAYGVSKLEAELGLRDISADTGMEVVVIRPPLVYGPNVRANFAALIRAITWGIPLPLGAVHNLRSLVFVDNLVDFILTCAEHPAAGNETFFVSDDEDVSSADLVRRLAAAMGRPARLVSIPPRLLVLGSRLVKRAEIAHRLLGSLQVDITKAKQRLGWSPPVSLDEGLRRTVASI